MADPMMMARKTMISVNSARATVPPVERSGAVAASDQRLMA
jgi:hypothetical protein